MTKSFEASRPKSDFDIHKTGTKAFKIESLFPHSFVPLQKDSVSKGWGKIMHTDGAGSKSVQNYLHWKETGNIDVFEWIADDVVAMNLDDVFCVGSDPNPEFVDYVAINRFRLPKEDFLKVLNRGFKRVFGTLEKYGIKVSWLGGETAELSDQVRTVDVSATIRARVKIKEAVSGGKVKTGDAIIGLGTFGKAVWEEVENSGIKTNGLLVARHSLMSPDYVKKYPEIADPEFSGYKGRFKTDQYLPELRMTVGEALISPTRIFSPVIKAVLEKYGNMNIHGIVHNTGGGLTKILRIGKGIHYIKDKLLSLPPIFSLIQRESGRSWQSIFEGLCCGIGVELVVPPKIAGSILKDVERFKIPASVIGHCEKSKGKNKVTIISKYGKFAYPYEKID